MARDGWYVPACPVICIWEGVSRSVCPRWPWTTIIPISASQTANYRHEPPVLGYQSIYLYTTSYSW
jgi:hypothetical protein